MGVTPAWRSISIEVWVLSAATWAQPSIREPVATQLAWPPAGQQAVEPPPGQAAARLTAVLVVPAAVVPVPRLEHVSGGYSPMPGKVPAPGLAIASSVAA